MSAEAQARFWALAGMAGMTWEIMGLGAGCPAPRHYVARLSNAMVLTVDADPLSASSSQSSLLASIPVGRTASCARSCGQGGESHCWRWRRRSKRAFDVLGYAAKVLGSYSKMSPPVRMGPLFSGITGPPGHGAWGVEERNWRGEPGGRRLEGRESETGDPAANGSPSGVERRIVSVEMMRDRKGCSRAP